MDKQKEWWGGEGGDSYHQRNWVDWQLRVPFFRNVLEKTGARSVLEFGCGPGWSLSACQRIDPNLETWGVEINEPARDQAICAGVPAHNSLQHARRCELVFTGGCLIHIPPDEINNVMKSLIEKSYRYVMCIEYEAEEETEIEYRGEMGLLWKRPYIEMYRSLGLTLLDKGKLQQDVGFDNCTYGLFTK